MKTTKCKRLCVYCRWFGLRVDFDSGSNYYCAKTGTALPAAVLRRPACRHYAPQPSAPYWGP